MTETVHAHGLAEYYRNSPIKHQPIDLVHSSLRTLYRTRKNAKSIGSTKDPNSQSNSERKEPCRRYH